MPWQAWAVWAAVGVVMEVYSLIVGVGPLTHWFFRIAENDWARAIVTAFFAWWVYHWYVEPRMFPGLKGPGPDDVGVGLLAGLLAFFGQRKK